jgi:molybdate transport system permease protein
LSSLADIVWLTLRLAGVTTAILLLVATPLAWWLAKSRAWWSEVVGALVALPIVLPPTVLGFYLLIALGPHSVLMAPLQAMGVRTLAFTFEGLVIGSVVYSLPFAVQPLRNAFQAIGERPLEAAATLGAAPLDAFLSVAVPLARPGFVVAAVLAFAHTVGDFAAVLMPRGGVPGETEALSNEIYKLVEAMDWGRAHLIAGGLLAFAFAVVLSLLLLERRTGRPRP